MSKGLLPGKNSIAKITNARSLGIACVGKAIRETTELPDVQKRMSTLGLNFDFRDSNQFRELITQDHQKYGAIIREAGIQPE